MIEATLAERLAFEARLTQRTTVPFGTDHNRLPRLAPEDYPFLGYTVTVRWQDGHSYRWHTDSLPDMGQLEEYRPSVFSLWYSAD